jgi:hypothetical protein
MGHGTGLLTFWVCAVLAGCGGSDAQVNAAAALEGNWAWAYGCDASLSIRLNPTDPAYQLMALKDIRAINATTAMGTAETRVFDNNTCSGAPIATHTRSVTFTIDNVVLMQGKSVLQVTRTLGSVGASINPAPSTVPSPLIYPEDYFSKTLAGKDLVLADSTHWFVGFDAPSPFDIALPSDTYPASLQTSPAFVKSQAAL